MVIPPLRPTAYIFIDCIKFEAKPQILFLNWKVTLLCAYHLSLVSIYILTLYFNL